MYNYNHLYYFYITVKLNGVTKAAKYLNTSQPSMSAQLRTLENQLKQKLFIKHGRNLVLSEDGQQVFNYCRKMFEVADELDNHLKGENQIRGRNLVRIGVSHEIDRPFVGDIINMAMRHLDFSSSPVISLVSENDGELIRDLKMHKLDVIVGNSVTYDDDFEPVATLNMPVALVAAPGLAETLGISSRATIQDVLKKGGRRLMLPSRQFRLRQEVDLYLQKKKLNSNLSLMFESDVISAIIRCVTDKMGLAFLPFPYIHRELKHNKIKIYPHTKVGLWNHKLTLLVRRQRKKNIFVDEMVAALKSLDH